MFEKYDAYKDSSVEWIGKIPTDWFNERLGTILEPISIKGNADKDLLSITREKGVILRDVEDDSENHNFIPDDLSNYKLIEKGQFGMNKMKAWQGSYGVSPYTGIVSPAYYIFRFIKPIYPDFFHWAIRSKTYISFFGSASDGVRIGQWDLSKDRMKNIPFVFPNIDSQKKIVEFIQDKAGKIDQAIAIKEQQIALLNERKQIVIQKAVTQGLDSNVPMKDSGVEWIGQIPEHWNVKPLKFYIAKKIDNRGRTPKFGDAGIPMLEVSNITDGDIYPIEKFEKFVLPEVVQRYERDKVEVGDILISTVGATSGKVVIIKNKPEYFICQNVVGFRMSKEINKQFISYALMSLYFKTSLMLINKGNTIDNLKVSVFVNNKVLVPSLDEQREIVEFIQHKLEEINVVINKYKDQIEKLKEYKTTLINDAVTGKIKVA